VLRRISLGESNKEAARALQISPSTVRTHVESIFRKLQCSTRAAAQGLAPGVDLMPYFYGINGPTTAPLR
jgi:DNA-binding CsgD family transcriptional regulator